MFMIKKRIVNFIFYLTSFSFLPAQVYFEADPFYLLSYEKSFFEEDQQTNPLIYRPTFKIGSSDKDRWSFKFRTEFFRNDNAPNLENTSVRWIGKGDSHYRSMSLSFVGEHIAFSLEPYYFTNQNLDYEVPVRKGIYTRMNDTRPHGDSLLVSSGMREVQFYLHHRGFGFGVSNASMWWGPGLHSSLQMSTNAPGFRHFVIGTLEEKRIRNLGFDLRYMFSHFDEKNAGEPYFSALLVSTTFYSEPQMTIGISRSYLSGHGTLSPTGPYTISKKDAMLLPFEGLYLESKQTDPEDPESAVDLWDEIMVGYVTATFPSSGLKIYLSYGRDDHAWDKKDFLRQPDHSAASVIGLRKYGLFGHENLVGGLEYVNLIKSKFWNKRVPGTWYSKQVYDYNSYNGRWYGAHSGPDSDDFTIYLGYMSDKFSIVPSFNYERHGVIDNTALVLMKRPYLVVDPETGQWYPEIREEYMESVVNIWPEVKFEFRLDVRFEVRNFRFNLYYEKEKVDNLEFNWGKRKGHVIWFGVERTFTEFKLSNPLKRFIKR